MPDYPDYTKPISITGVTIDTLPIDIKAQTLGHVDIDIAAVTTSAVLNIDIKAVSDAVPVSNLGNVVNPGFEQDWCGWGHPTDYAWIDEEIYHTGIKSVKIGHFNYVFQVFSPPIRGDRIKSFKLASRCSAAGTNKAIVSLDYTDGTAESTNLSYAEADTWYVFDISYDTTKEILDIALLGKAGAGGYCWFDSIGLVLKEVVDAVNVTVNVDIVAQTVGNINIDIAAQTVGNLNVNIAASAATVNVNITASAVTLNVDVQNAYLYVRTEAAQNLNIDIAAQTVGNLTIDIAAITTTANLNVDIKAQTVDLNIKTSGGVNLVIDKLTQTAYLEDRRTLLNDNGVTTPTAPPSNRTAATYYGKFFPRGCRGQLNAFYIYCKRTGAGTITLAYSPQPGMGQVGTVTITPGSSWDWKFGLIRAFWNYDSMFVWVIACSADVSWGYDETEPCDQYKSIDSGVTWIAYSERVFIRPDMKAMTVGDLPVSGTINTIEIVRKTASTINYTLDVPAGVGEELYVTIPGSGKILFVSWWITTLDHLQNLRPRVECDGNQVLPYTACNFDTIESKYISNTISTEPLGWSKWDTEIFRYCFFSTIKFPFERLARIGVRNGDPDNPHAAIVHIVVELAT